MAFAKGASAKVKKMGALAAKKSAKGGGSASAKGSGRVTSKGFKKKVKREAKEARELREAPKEEPKGRSNNSKPNMKAIVAQNPKLRGNPFALLNPKLRASSDSAL